MVAMLGGFLGSKSDREPGTESLWLGLRVPRRHDRQVEDTRASTSLPPLDPAEDMGKDQPLVLIHLNSARIRQNIFRPLCDQRCSWGSEWILKKSPTFLMVCPYWFRLRRVREGRMSTRELLASHSYSTINAGSTGICKAVASALVLLAIPMIAITSAYCSSVSPLARAAAVWECTQ
jgi:hypothetical protein